jgi:L-fuculose-phosphate aldolase
MASLDSGDLRAKVATACHILCQQVENFDYLGHISVRLPDGQGILIKGQHASVGNMMKLTAEQIITVDMTGKRTGGEYAVPSEIFMHTQIYLRRPDVQSIVHSHQKLATLFSMVDKDMLPVYHPIRSRLVFGKDGLPLPKFPSADLIYTRELADAVASALGERNIVLLQNHGVVVVGNALEEAVLRAVALEEQAEWNLLASGFGTYKSIPAASLQKARDSSTAGPWKYLCSLVEKEKTGD